MRMAMLLFLLTLGAGFGAEVRDGLVLELDATRLVLPDKWPVDRWVGTNGRIAVQPVAASRPLYRRGNEEAFLRFDGKDDFLHLSFPGRSARDLTVFVLAAPQGNAGGFSGMFAAAQSGQNDYISGLNLDFGPVGTTELSVLNVESAGSQGFRDLLQPARNLASELPFGGFHVFCVRSRAGEGGTELFLDGLRLGARPRSDSRIGLEEMVIGGRMFSNDPGQGPFAQGFFHGDLAAVLVYDRALPEQERTEVERALFARTPGLNALASGARGHALQTLDQPPPVQMLVPGFVVRELPVELRNQNNLRYRHDGKLVALGYDGRIHLLSDTDGDGLEETSAVFWDKAPLRGPIGMDLLPAGDPRGDGVFVASKAKVSLILDENRDGVADREIVIAEGWKETPHGVDTLGLAVDPRDGSVYFSIGCENFANGYLLDAAGQSQFDLGTERGTIQRIAPDFSRRETVCTGVRFACALAFNRAGDLFATDQEGATWLANGNPLDELLHIVPGRHYGFPPRHPRHLPNVIDEPPIMEYGPQHQSTVGMVFNEGVNGGPAFGPTHWQGDVLVCGAARGKLYRTKLVSTPEGYVADNQLIACLGFLAIDACVSPQGDLLVACHTGPPDWGTGPAGAGKIFKISYERRDVPQPVWAWAAGADEFRVAFDRPVQIEDWVGAKDKTRIEAGRFVSAGDRFESIRPGYQIVRDQMAAPRRWVDVHSLSLTADKRTLVLRVARQTEPDTYAITLPVPSSWQTEGGLEQVPEMDLALTLNGVEATKPSRVVLPHPSIPVSQALTVGSLDHAAFFDQVAHADAVELRAQVDVSNIFVPATQPGSRLDWDIESDAFANETMEVRPGTIESRAPRPPERRWAELTFPQDRSGAGPVFALGERIRPIPKRRLYVPWANESRAADSGTEPKERSDVKGGWLAGRRLYFGEAGCATCHTVRGEGTAFGPDLSNLIHRDRDSVVADILKPSATINPDHAGTTVRFKDGTEVHGLIGRLTEEKVVLRLPAGVEVERTRSDVAAMEPMTLSLMPDTLEQILSPAQMEDLLTFLLVNPLDPAPLTRIDPPPPPPRTRAELAGFLPPPGASLGSTDALRILLCGDAKDHGDDEHDYPLWLERWTRLLALADAVTVDTATGFPKAEQLAAADVTVFYSRNSGWDLAAAASLDAYQKRGGGLVYLHWGIEGGQHAEALSERIGLAFAGSRFRHGEMDLLFAQASHPIIAGFEKLRFIDESYWALRGNPVRVAVLADSVEEGGPRPQLWVMQREQGRIFVCIPGHYTWTFDDPLYRLLVLRGIAWAAGEANVERLAELSLVGARIGE